MTKRPYDLFDKGSILLKNISRVKLKDFCNKRSLSAYYGTDINGFYEIVFIRDAKSKLLKKDADELNLIVGKCECSFGFNIKKRVLFYNSKICNKALNELKHNKWRCYDFV